MYSLKQIFPVCKRFDKCNKCFLESTRKLFKCDLIIRGRGQMNKLIQPFFVNEWGCYFNIIEILILFESWNQLLFWKSKKWRKGFIKEKSHKYVLHLDWLLALTNDCRVSHSEVPIETSISQHVNQVQMNNASVYMCMKLLFASFIYSFFLIEFIVGVWRKTKGAQQKYEKSKFVITPGPKYN